MLLGVVAVLVVGLPLLALGVDRVLPQLKGRPVAPTAVQLLAHRHHLLPRDLLEVQAAVEQGRAASPVRLAPAAVEHATRVAGLKPGGRLVWRGRPVGDRTRRMLLVVPPLVFVGYVVVGLLTSNDTLTTFGVGYLVWLVLLLPVQRRAWRRRTAAARSAITANNTTSEDTMTGDRQ